MARKTQPTDAAALGPKTEVNLEVGRELATAADLARQLEAEQAEKTHALAVQLGFQGDLAPSALAAGIRYARNQLGSAIFDMGTRLLLLKSAVGHGAFGAELEALDIDQRTANRFMCTVRKLSKFDTLSNLSGNGTFTKLIELAQLDDEDLQVLDAGGEFGGVTVEAIDTMTAKELRAALREAKAAIEAKDKVVGKQAERLTRIEEERAHPARAKLLKKAQRQDLFTTATSKRLAALAELPKFLDAADELSTMADQGGDEEAGTHVMTEVAQLVETFVTTMHTYGYDIADFMPGAAE